MYCPEGYFTPKMLEQAFFVSLSREAVRDTVFRSAGQSAAEIPLAHAEEVLRCAAELFVHRFITDYVNEIRACNVVIDKVIRVDPWLASGQPHPVQALPSTRKCVEKISALTCSTFTVLDQELWVIDCKRVISLAASDPIHERIALLTMNFDGWSLCFPDRIYPSDVGTLMNGFAKQIGAARAAMPLPLVKRGRPTKIDRVTACIAENWPDGLENVNRGVVQTRVQRELKVGVSMTTISKAINLIRKS